MKRFFSVPFLGTVIGFLLPFYLFLYLYGNSTPKKQQFLVMGIVWFANVFGFVEGKFK
jgi:YbbR domain-containing protein